MPLPVPLNDVQRLFKDHLLNNDSEGPSQNFYRLFRQDGGVSCENRLKIYRNNILTSCSQAIAAAYPLTEKLVGRDFFRQTVRAFILEYPPAEGNLNLYGAVLPDFIKGYKPAQSLPYLADFARLEWARHAAFYAPDDSALNPEDLSRIRKSELPGLRLTFRRSFTLLQSAFPLDEIFAFCRNEKPDINRLGIQGVNLLIGRPRLEIIQHELDASEYVFLQGLAARETIHEATIAAIEKYPDFNLTAVLERNLRRLIFAA